MNDVTPPVVEQDSDELRQRELVELSVDELGKVGAGICDPGLFDVEK